MNLSDIYGFEEVSKKLHNDLEYNKLHSCNLIVGNKGIGKASFVRNFAASVLSHGCNNDHTHQTNLKDTQTLIANGGHTDLFILDINTMDADGKENTSKKNEINIKQVRKTIDDIKLTSSLSKNKVLIIDSIDNVNKNGQNALLKTLEEPPNNTFIFLISHDIHEVINTIISRSNIINIPDINFENWKKAMNNLHYEAELSDEDMEYLYNISDHSVGMAFDIIINDAIDMYDQITEVILTKDILSIQKLANRASTNECFKLFKIFINKLFQELIESRYREDKFELSINISNILKKSNFENILKYYEFANNIIKDVETYNLDKKHSINVLFCNIFII